MARDKNALAAQVWKQMFDFFMRGAPQRGKVLARLGLTPNDARALSALDPVVGRTMRSLSDEWGCDASNTTWIVDRLEKRGFAERRSKVGDRRVKLVLLTREGVKARQRLVQGMYEPPAELLKLSREQLETLARIVPTRGESRAGSST